MTYVLIHDRGRVLKLEQRPYVDPTIEKPVFKARPRGTWKGWREVKMPKAHNGYKPGYVYDLGSDQCRYIAGDDHVMCGAQVQEGSSYCSDHRQLTTKKSDAKGS